MQGPFVYIGLPLKHTLAKISGFLSAQQHYHSVSWAKDNLIGLELQLSPLLMHVPFTCLGGSRFSVCLYCGMRKLIVSLLTTLSHLSALQSYFEGAYIFKKTKNWKENLRPNTPHRLSWTQGIQTVCLCSSNGGNGEQEQNIDFYLSRFTLWLYHDPY